MERLRSLIVPVALAVVSCTGCMTPGGKPSMNLTSLNKTLKESLPASATTPSAVPKTAPATQFAAAWQTKLGQLPDPTKNGVMNSGIVGQAFLFTDKLAAADIVGSLTVVVNDATDRANGAAAKQPNVWHFDVETLKRMVVHDDRFGKSIALFLPWPEEWNDVNRLYVQARYDAPNNYTVYAPPASVTLDLFSPGHSQTTHTSGRVPAGQTSVPDPKLLMQNAKANAAQSNAATTNPVQPASYSANWPTNIGVLPAGMGGMKNPGTVPTANQPPAMVSPPQAGGEPKEFQRMVIPRN